MSLLKEQVSQKNTFGCLFVGTTNTNEKWHAAKPVVSGIKKISQGAKKWMGTKWHPQLADKGALMRNHIYWSIDNCDNDGKTLQANIESAILHFQNIHKECGIESKCKEEDYIPTYTVVTDPVAIKLITNFIKGLTVYKFAADFVHNKDTFFIESLNNATLQYLDKRVHFRSDENYKMRYNLVILDWNEHVDRPITSTSARRLSVYHNGRVKAAKVYKRKTFKFVNDIWFDLLHMLATGHTLKDSTRLLDNDDNECYDEETSTAMDELFDVFDSDSDED